MTGNHCAKEEKKMTNVKRYYEVEHGKRTINGTDWPIISYVEKIGPKKWLAVYNLCNGVPDNSETFTTLREAREAIAPIIESIWR